MGLMQLSRLGNDDLLSLASNVVPQTVGLSRG